jgi:hypothetical protein
VTILSIDSTASEEAVLYAQTIIDHFSKGLQNSMCMSQVPIALYVEAKQHKERIEDIDKAIHDTGINSSTIDSEIREFKQTPLARAIIRRSGNGCLNCGITAPKLNVSAMIGDSLLDAKKFLKDVQNIFKLRINKALPSFAYLLSFLCIPDLVKLLALIISSVIDILATVFVGSFSLMGFIMAIINQVISALFRFVNIMLNFSISPILCIIDALDQIMRSIPTPSNISNAINPGSAQPGKIDKFADQMSTSIINARNSGSERLSEEFSSITDTVKSSVEDLNNNIEKLLGVKTHFECEAKRSGSSISDSVERLSTLIAIANLIKSVLSKKTKKTARNANTNIAGMPVSPLDDQLSNEEIVEALAESIGHQVDIVNDGQNNIGVYIGDKSPLSDNLNLFSCNLAEFIESANMDRLIEDSIIFAENELKGEGYNPRFYTPKVVNISNVDVSSPMFIRLQNTQDDNIITSIKDIFDFMGKVNPYEDDRSTQNLEAIKVTEVPKMDNPYFDNSLTINQNVANNIKSASKIRGRIDSSFNANNVQLHNSLEELGTKLSQLSSR